MKNIMTIPAITTIITMVVMSLLWLRLLYACMVTIIVMTETYREEIDIDFNMLVHRKSYCWNSCSTFCLHVRSEAWQTNNKQ